MDDERKKSLWLAIILGLIIFVSIFTFVWSNFLNQGKLAIHGPAPFLVEVFGGQQLECKNSPCLLSDKIGEKQLIIAKKGFETLVTEANFKLWRTSELFITFDVIPYIEEIEDFPETETSSLEIVFDENAQMQKLIQNSSPIAIVFFPKNLKDPQIFYSENFALIVDKSHTYKIDLIEKTKEEILALKDVKEGEWSKDGKFFVFTTNENSFYSVLTEQKIVRTTLNSENSKVSWSENTLFFITNQILQSTADSALMPVPTLSAAFTVGTYDPSFNNYEKIYSFPDLTSLPEKFLAAGNGKNLYLQKDKKKFRIILEKF